MIPKIEFECKVLKTDTCWFWTGKKNKAGYGLCYIDQKYYLAHRVAYEIYIEPVPEGLEVDHVKDWGCTDVSCVNPGHLQAVTQYENNMRSNSFAAERKRATECIHGHEFTPENTIIARNKTRHCRTCKNNRRRKTRHNN